MNHPEQTDAPTADAWPPEPEREDSQAESASTQVSEPSHEPASDLPPSQATTELLSEILTSVYRAEGMTAQGFSALRERLDAIEARLAASSGGTSATDSDSSLDSLLADESQSSIDVLRESVSPTQTMGVSPAPSAAKTFRLIC